MAPLNHVCFFFEVDFGFGLQSPPSHSGLLFSINYNYTALCYAFTLHRYSLSQPNGPPLATAAHTHRTSTLSRPPSHSGLRSLHDTLSLNGPPLATAAHPLTAPGFSPDCLATAVCAHSTDTLSTPRAATRLLVCLSCRRQPICARSRGGERGHPCWSCSCWRLHLRTPPGVPLR